VTKTAQDDATSAPDGQHLDRQRATVIARLAARTAARGSLESVLARIATELQQLDGMAAVQLILGAPLDGPLRMMGSAGFSTADGFFDRLFACRARGAALATDAAFGSLEQRVYPDRRRLMLADTRWQPMHAYISEIPWSDFVATPFSTEGHVKGVINCYTAPDTVVTEELLEFLRDVADQAALAVDYHDLLERDRIRVRSEERQRLARDLHDSVIQSVFAIGMRARTLEALAARRGDDEVVEFAREFGELAELVQHDLRGVVTALQPSTVAELGLLGAIDRLVETTRRSSDLQVDVSVAAEISTLDPEVADDVFHIVGEALHNAVKHSGAHRVIIAVDLGDTGVVSLSVSDDGAGFRTANARVGYGLASMRYRATRWGGSFEILSGTDARGTTVRSELLALGPGDERRNGR